MSLLKVQTSETRLLVKGNNQGPQERPTKNKINIRTHITIQQKISMCAHWRVCKLGICKPTKRKAGGVRLSARSPNAAPVSHT
mmetsp:Transcript_91/g.199  ORF Transcript_91/g.199 Transcript_91/m.199 type:complete len:83 (+) Transcript_91:151-399(+)